MPETPEEERDKTPQDYGHPSWASLFKEWQEDYAARKREDEQGKQDVKTLLNDNSKAPAPAKDKDPGIER